MLLRRFASLTLAGGLLLSAVGCATDWNQGGTGGGLFSRWKGGSCCGSTCGGTVGQAPVMAIPGAGYAPAQVVPGNVMTPGNVVIPGAVGAGNCNCPQGGAVISGAIGGGNCNCPQGGAGMPIMAGTGIPGGGIPGGNCGIPGGSCGGAPSFYPAGQMQDGGVFSQGPIGQMPAPTDFMQQAPMANNTPLILQPAPGMQQQPQPIQVPPSAPKIFTVPQPGGMPTPSNYAVPEPYRPTTLIQPGI